MKTICFILGIACLARVPAYADPTSLEERIAKENQWKSDGLSILPYRPNYLMPFSYNPKPNTDAFPAGTTLQKIETKFQLSVKVPLVDHLFHYDVTPYLAYTQASYWQSYNKAQSSFFRDTDYEPEFFLQFNTPKEMGPMTNRYNRLGYDHQSNGQGGSLSRSWNRIYADFVFDYKNAYLSIKPWYRIAGPAYEDSNPNMEKYFGYGELRGAVKLEKQRTLDDAAQQFKNPGQQGRH